MSKSALQAGNDCLWQNKAKNSKMEQNEGAINDDPGSVRMNTTSGDLEPKKTRSVVVSVFPEALSRNNRNQTKATKTTGRARNNCNQMKATKPTGRAPSRKSYKCIAAVAPKVDELPKDHSLVEYFPMNMGLLLGTKHTNILTLSLKYPRTKDQVKGQRLLIWGPDENVKGLYRAIEAA
jgi:hypothetical protein